MEYEDMVHEQEDQTWFEVQDQMSALNVRLRILDGSELFMNEYPDCIEITDSDGECIVISPRSALHILQWLQHHQERLTQAYNKMVGEI